MSKIFYHNVTQNKVNELEIVDLIYEYKDGDIIYKSESGDACIELITSEELLALKKEVKEWYDENYPD